MDFVNREEIERKLARVLSRDLRAELGKLLDYLGDPPRLENVPPEYWQNGWRTIQHDVEPVLLDVYLTQAMNVMLSVGIGVSLDNINHQGVNWARSHTEELLRGMWQGRKDITSEPNTRTPLFNTSLAQSITLWGMVLVKKVFLFTTVNWLFWYTTSFTVEGQLPDSTRFKITFTTAR